MTQIFKRLKNKFVMLNIIIIADKIFIHSNGELCRGNRNGSYLILHLRINIFR